MLGLIWIQTVYTLMVFQKEFFEKVDFEKKSADDKKACNNFPGGKELNHMGLVRRKPIFMVCDKVKLKPACSAT